MPRIPENNPVTLNFKDRVSNLLNRYKRSLVLVFLLIIVAIAAKIFFFTTAVITVVGTGTLSVTPTQVEMTVSRVDSSVDPVAAINQGESNTKLLIDESQTVVSNPDIQRAFYQMTPTVVGGERLYQVVNVFKLTSTEPGKTSDLIKALYASGAITINNVNFLPDKQDDVTQEVRRAALKDAREQAKRIAAAAGKRVGSVVSITDDYTEASSTVASQEKDTSLISTDFTAAAPDKIEVTKQVSVTYKIW